MKKMLAILAILMSLMVSCNQPNSECETKCADSTDVSVDSNFVSIDSTLVDSIK